jgi:hypothetical protein
VSNRTSSCSRLSTAWVVPAMALATRRSPCSPTAAKQSSRAESGALGEHGSLLDIRDGDAQLLYRGRGAMAAVALRAEAGLALGNVCYQSACRVWHKKCRNVTALGKGDTSWWSE